MYDLGSLRYHVKRFSFEFKTLGISMSNSVSENVTIICANYKGKIQCTSFLNRANCFLKY